MEETNLIMGIALAFCCESEGEPHPQDDSTGPALPAGWGPFSGLDGSIPLPTNSASTV